MVNNEGFLIEDESSETTDDDDDVEQVEKAPKRAPSRSLFDIEAFGAKEKAKKDTERKLSLSALFERKEISDDEKKEAEDKKKLTIKGSLGSLVEKEDAKNDDDKAEETEAEIAPKPEQDTETTTDESAEETEVVHKTEAEPEPVTEKAKEPAEEPKTEKAPEAVAKAEKNEEPEKASKEVMEAADWEDEGEINDEGEIKLAGSTAEKTPMAAKEEEPGEAFAEIPTTPAESSVEPTVETEPAEPELLERGLGSEGPPEPPEIEPPSDEEEEPEEPTPPVVASGGGGGYGAGRIGNWYTAPGAVTPGEKELSDAELHGRREGTRRGVVTGLLFGWLLGRRGKNKAAREHAEELKSKNKEITELQKDQNTSDRELHTVINNQETIKEALTKQTEKVKDLERAQAESKKDLGEKAVKSVETASASRQSEKERSNRLGANTEAFENRPKSIEQLRQAKLELAPEERVEKEEDYQTAEGRRVETSAWHRIEIDEKTGRAVEDPTVAYGREFLHEQHQEVKHDDDFGMGGGSATSAASSLGELATSSSAQQPGGFSPASNQAEMPDAKLKDTKKNDPHHAQLTAGAELLHFASMPIIWVAAVLIVVVLFAFGLLH